MTARANPGFSVRRIAAMVLRYWYILRGSWPRILELAYWPTLQMIMWGFMTLYLREHSTLFAQAAGVLIAAVLLWDVLFRSQLGVSISFMEEMWSRNLGNIFVSPLRPYEFVSSLILMSLIRTLIGVLPASILAILLYQYSVFDMGFALLAFFVNLIIMGWSMGLVIVGLLVRFGQSAESLAWLVLFVLLPFCGVYYPLSVMPDWLEAISRVLPAAHVFEGMRAVLIQGVFRWDLLVNAIVLNVCLLCLASFAFHLFFRAARKRGLLLQVGE